MERFEFRAWDKKIKQIYLVGVIDFANKKVQIAVVDKHGNCYAEYWRKFDEIILMQYTGLTDKNGTKIFEGDILKCQLWDGTWENYIIQYEDAEFVALNKNKSNFIISDIWNQFEIIGNIHEEVQE